MGPSLNNTINTIALPPVYFELSWAILSTTGIALFLLGLMVAGITGTLSAVCLVPMVVSAAGALANGLCYYAYYTPRSPLSSQAAAGAVADLAWLVQEAGLSFYSYVILDRVLGRGMRRVFRTSFWGLMVAIAGTRLAITVARCHFILGNSQNEKLLFLVGRLHVGYFTAIALVECISAGFLLHRFHVQERGRQLEAAVKGRLFGYLMRSTEVRMGLLAVVGVTRACTFSFQFTAVSAQGVAGQLDRFAYCMECFFPAVMYVDILASRLVFAHDRRQLSGSAGWNVTHLGHTDYRIRSNDHINQAMNEKLARRASDLLAKQLSVLGIETENMTSGNLLNLKLVDSAASSTSRNMRTWWRLRRRPGEGAEMDRGDQLRLMKSA